MQPKPIMPIEVVSARLKDLDLPKIWRDIDISYNTLKNVRDGRGANYSTVKKIGDYLQAQDAKK